MLQRRFLGLACLVLVCGISRVWGQAYAWVGTFGGVSDENSEEVAADAAGNTVHVGYFHQSFDADPGPGTVTLVSQGLYDMFIQKLDTAGELVWAVRIGGANNEYGNDVLVDDSGAVYVTGSFAGTVDFDPSPVILNRTSAGALSCFVLKLTANGDFVWVSTMGGSGSTATGYTMDLDDDGNVVVAGYWTGTVDRAQQKHPCMRGF